MRQYLLFLLPLALLSCRPEAPLADAYGHFEAREILVPAEASGKILFLDIQEGQALQPGQVVGLIDTTALYLKKLQLLASGKAIQQKKQDPTASIRVLEEQLAHLQREKKRLEPLVAQQAVPSKQLDDITSQIQVVGNQIAAARENARLANQGILAELDPLQAQLLQIDDQLAKCRIVNPIQGTVLLQLAEPAEFAMTGKPLYKVADLEDMRLRAYITGEQLPGVQVGQAVEVHFGKDESLPGKIEWIASEAEFSPKFIETREERVNLVYAILVSAPHSGQLKIGMPGEVWFK